MPNQPEQKVSPGMEIYGALLKVAEAVDVIVKEYRGDLGYTIAGAEQVMAAVRPHLIKQQVLVFPVESDIYKLGEVTTKSGRIMNRSIVKMKWRFLHIPSGTYFDVPVEGEGQDMGDKSINKARTICQKYALRQALMLEFGDADPDKESSERQERSDNAEAKPTKAAKDKEVEMAGKEAWGFWLELIEEAKKLDLTYPEHVFPLPLAELKESYRKLNNKVKESQAPEEATTKKGGK